MIADKPLTITIKLHPVALRRLERLKAYVIWTNRGANWRRVKREMRKAERAVRI